MDYGDKFKNCFAMTLVMEGGYANNSHDSGGETNFGITHETYDAWRKSNKLPIASVKNISRDEVEAIYRDQYWLPINGDKLPDGIDLAVFDFAVNSGVRQASKDLQACAGAYTDGFIGVKTLAAVDQCHMPTLLVGYMTMRLKFLDSLPEWRYFSNAWISRCVTITVEALQLIHGEQS